MSLELISIRKKCGTMSRKIDKTALRETILNVDGLSDEDKSQILELLSEQKKYGLVWEDSTETVVEKLKEDLPVLEELEEKRILNDTKDQQNPNHIIIEGDNYQALFPLLYTHEGKIDIIYIDPPYNTGNKDFIYNDSFVDKEDSFRHSKWLSFMDKRLRIAKRLLSDKGVIFISIDDNEQANLKLLCDEILGESNLIAQMIWKQGKKHTGNLIGVNHEYMIIYAKNKDLINDNTNKWKTKKDGLDKIYKEYNRLRNQYGEDYLNIQDGITKFYNSLADSDPSKEHKHYSKVDQRGLFFPDNISQGTGKGSRYDVLHPFTHKPTKIPRGGWRYSSNTMNELLLEDRIYFGLDETTVPCRKRYLRETEFELPSSVFYKDGRAATKEVETILCQNGIFNNPKDREIIQKILSFKENKIILDFFAGSGTTLHATMQLNKEDGGKRQCILVTNNENNICEEVTYERNKRVIQGYTKPNGEIVEGLKENNLRYYKVGFVPRDSSIKGKRQLMEASTDLLCIKNDLYDERFTFGNINLRSKIARYFEDDKQKMLIIYKEEAIPSLVEEIDRMSEDTHIKVYVFSANNYAMHEDFTSVEDKVSLCALPSAIYNAYLKVLPKKINITIGEEENI